MRSLRVLVIMPFMGAVQACTSLVPVPVVVSSGVAGSKTTTPPSVIRLAKAPPGFVAFCERSPDQCTATTGSAPLLSLDAETWDILNGVNTATNLTIAPKADLVHYGT